MRKTSRALHAPCLALLSLLALVGACKKNDPAPAAPVRPVPPPPTFPGPSPEEAKALLTEAKLTAFAAYQDRLVTATAEAAAAYQRAGGDARKGDASAANDERIAKVAAAGKAALEKSGLSRDEAAKLSRLVMPYYGRIFATQDALKRATEIRARIDEAKAKGREPSASDVAMDRMHGAQAARLDAVRKDFGERYGAEALALVQKHEVDFQPIHEKMLEAARLANRAAETPATPATPAKR